jgi:hypothetical protein
MSILTVLLVPEGMLFGADRTVTVTQHRGPVDLVSYDERPKVLKWPNGHALVGYVGLARIGTKPANTWLYEFIGRHSGREPAQDLSQALVADLEMAIPKSVREQNEMILHLGTFETREGLPVPQCWYIRNLDANGKTQAHFEAREELFLPHYFGQFKTADMRGVVEGRASAYDPFWFHQGADLATFNTLDAVLRAMFRLLVDKHPAGIHQRPTSLDDWARYLRMSILTFGAYYEAFRSPAERVVGGGADVEWIEWGK